MKFRVRFSVGNVYLLLHMKVLAELKNIKVLSKTYDENVQSEDFSGH